MKAEEMRQKIQDLKSEAQSLLDSNQVKDAETKTFEAKKLSAQVEIQDKLEKAETDLEEVRNSFTSKGEEVANLTSQLETAKTEKSNIMEKYNDATSKVAELNGKVEAMQPIVDKFHEDEKKQKLDTAQESYKAKFEKVEGLELFESEDIQNLVIETISEDKEVSNNAKYSLSEKIMDLIDAQDVSSLTVKSIQEKSKETKNINPENDEFEKMYGFKEE